MAKRHSIKATQGPKGGHDMALASARAKNDRIEARVTSTVKAKLLRAAELEGVSLSTFLIQSAVERADDVILRNQRIIELSKSDQEAFAKWLLDPPAPTEELVEALRNHKREFDSR